MPLYGSGLRRPSILRAALAVNDVLGLNRNVGLRDDVRLPAGRILSVSETAQRFPEVERSGLKGSAIWYDVVMPSPQRVIGRMLRWASASGATLLNYVEVVRPIVHAGTIVGVEALDIRSGTDLAYHAPVVVNCAGPWSRNVAAIFHRDFPHLFHPSVALNVLLDCPPPANAAVAVDPPLPNARTYFLYGWNGKTLAGTYHAPSPDERPGKPIDRGKHLDAFLMELRAAVPGVELSEQHVLRVFAGYLPAVHQGSVDLTKRPVLLDHAASGGPRGLYSVSGIKFTTARRVAERTLRAIPWGRRKLAALPADDGPPTAPPVPAPEAFRKLLDTDPNAARAMVVQLARAEGVREWDDLLFRRTDWATDPTLGKAIRDHIGQWLAGEDLPVQIRTDHGA
jgi:glycerol-3-phosphate dehydrogenase